MDTQYQIVIADDHPLFRTALLQAVKAAAPNADIHEADSVDNLLRLLDELKTPDLLLLDLKMPGANGFSALTHLHAQHAGIPVVIVSASEEIEVVRKAQQLGAMGFIPKSSPLSKMVSAIEQLLEGNSSFPEGYETHADMPALDPIAERLANLTPQQYKVLVMLNEGLLNKQIAYELSVSEATIKAHVTAIFRKLDVKNRTQAVIALQQMELEPEQ
ncbi:DNA-binding response regulator [Alginatibacterium sediminis]|uniref:DNA-binding response regulator n=1 Tax=Alginatibacterium sediminis TaxID=2164068 RepID=A0A420E757_9ALTE|nr:response regulator transcription factor [Alginatibacterium sediminis]RKF14480.1 DNA-binding response regulator [Alginatibacterium sediminis]